MEFVEFPKMARLSREIVITEKIDGTNAQVTIAPIDEARAGETLTGKEVAIVNRMAIYAGSRSRWIVPGDDNFGFALWVSQNAQALAQLGEGSHFGEWWGSGVQRGYGLPKGEKRFSLFNVHRWDDPAVRPACCHVVPTLYRGDFDMGPIREQLDILRTEGSVAAPGFMSPEGIVVFHTAANLCFKKTIHKDEVPKALAA